MVLAAVGFVTGWALGTVFMLLLVKKQLTGAYEQGQQDALRVAIEMAKDRADVAIALAPLGEMSAAMLRAQTAHQLEMDLRNLKRSLG